MENTFKNRFLEFRKSIKPKCSQEKLAGILGISQGIISQYESGKSRPEREVLKKIELAFPWLNQDWLMDGTGEMRAPIKYITENDENTGLTLHDFQKPYSLQTDEEKSNRIDLINQQRKLPLLTMNKLARFQSKEEILTLTDLLKNEESYAVLPEHNFCDYFVEIDGDDMFPTFEPQEKVAARLKTSTTFIKAGAAYILNVEGDILIRRVYETENPDLVKLVADNINYPAQIIRREWIKFIFSVHAVLKNHTGKRLAA